MTYVQLDRIENDLYVFVEKGNQGNQVEISIDLVPIGIIEGYIVDIDNLNGLYIVKQEKEIRKSDVQN